ncbi:unnamed protein product [Alopecurus aequalis]
MEQQGDRTQLLPGDMLAAVLHRLAPRSLATSRCVCKAWRDTIDARRMLRTDLLPLSLAGFFINFHNLRYSEFFARPSSPSASGPSSGRNLVYRAIDGQCNGLLLYDYHNMVVNPATGWWSAPLPPPPPKRPEMECLRDDAYLAFDPMVSPHYQVLRVPRIPYIELDVDSDDEYAMDHGVDPAMLGLEWPPSSLVLQVFSSSTKRWDERTFLREGEAAGTVADWAADYIWMWNKSNSVYWHGALHVYCQNGFVMRLSLSSTNTYQVIKPPEFEPESYLDLHVMLGKSKKGVYYASIGASRRLRVWVLDESCAHSKWVLEHDTHLKLPPTRLNNGQQVYGPWILQDINYSEEKYLQYDDDNDTTLVENNFEWNSDDDEEKDVLEDTKDMVDRFGGEISILGFHPFKEIVFMSRGLDRGLAYHLNTSKIQDIGYLFPKHYPEQHRFVRKSFPYTPCWME